MTGVVSNGMQFTAGLDERVERFDKQVAHKMKLVMEFSMHMLLRLTPVNTGTAAMNYVASAGKPYSGAAKVGPKAVESTNKLALGTEQRRPAAEAVSLATLRGLDFSVPYQTYYITNTAPHIAGLESGELPGPPHTPRSPGGMFRVTLEEVSSRLNSGQF